MQTILGTIGVIGRGLARELTAYTDQTGDQILKANLTLLTETDKAVPGQRWFTLPPALNTKQLPGSSSGRLLCTM